MKILDLPLKKKWYEMIESGKKREEYRECKDYWRKRLIDLDTLRAKPYTHVRFRYGYTKRTMLFKIDSITINVGNPDWGAPEYPVFIIKFHKENYMKSYTDLPQSWTLAKILPHDTADQTWERAVINGSGLNMPDELKYTHNGNFPFILYSGIGLPCWSLAALLDVLPKNCGRYTKSLYWFDDAWHCEYVDEDGAGILGTSADNAIDACYEMILNLHE